MFIMLVVYVSGEFVFADVESDTLDVNQVYLDSLEVEAQIDSLLSNSPSSRVDLEAYKELFSRMSTYKDSARKTFRWDEVEQNYYSIQNHLFGVESDNYHIRVNHFTELNNVAPSYMVFQQNARFYDQKKNGLFYDFSKSYYQLPVTVIETMAGMGDYELGSAFFGIKKNHFLNKYNLDYRMNFLKGRFYWGQESASNSSVNFQMPLYGNVLDINYSSVGLDGLYHKLSPVFRIDQLMYSEKTRKLSLYYLNDYVNFGVKLSSEEYSKIAPVTLERELIQFSFEKEYIQDNIAVKYGYEYLIHDENFNNQELNSLSSDVDHILNCDVKYDLDKYTFEQNLVVTNPTQLLSSSKLNYAFNDNITLSLFSDSRKSSIKEEIFTEIDTLNNNLEDFTYLNEKNYSGITIQLNNSNWDITSSIGNALIDFELIPEDYEENYKAVRFDLSGSYKYWYKKYSLKLSTNIKGYQDYNNYDIVLTPGLTMTNRLDLVKDIEHNNLLKMGLSHYYVSEYVGYEDNDKFLYPNTSLLDFYVGIQITKLF